MRFYHSNTDASLELSKESNRIIRLVTLIKVFLNEDDHTYFIDDLGNSLRLSITIKLLELFFEISQKNNKQIIFTTSESRILAQDMLREDEIVIANKKISGESHVNILESFNLRADKRVYQTFFDDEDLLNTAPKFNYSLIELAVKRRPE